MPQSSDRVQASDRSRSTAEISPVRHVLFDADGVLQEVPGGWVASVTPYFGERAEEFLVETWSDEKPFLRGGEDYLAVLAATLQKYDVGVPVEEVYAAVWHRIEVSEASLDIVRRLRCNGYGVHLGTNQERHRAAYMRSELGYDELFGVSCYSCELGVAKPDPAFFSSAAELIGAAPGTILFVDDTAKNVAGARDAGLLAEQWELADGHDRLRDLLAQHGVSA